ncbi:hypothetical protein EDB83DRAFT_2685447 [Lactarius deliciosus]|nr:hypothetical protein EDB83DRAFT_2685447 [Lactarius deliciosus]
MRRQTRGYSLPLEADIRKRVGVAAHRTEFWLPEERTAKITLALVGLAVRWGTLASEDFLPLLLPAGRRCTLERCEEIERLYGTLFVQVARLTFDLAFDRLRWDESKGRILSVVKASKGQNAVEVAVPTAHTDINAAYEDAIHVLSTKLPKEEKEEDATTMQEDYDRNFRTNVLLTWVLSNALLVAVIPCVPCFTFAPTLIPALCDRLWRLAM